MQETGFELIQHEIQGPVSLVRVCNAHFKRICFYLEDFMQSLDDQNSLINAAQLCYRLMLLIGSMRDVVPLYPGPGAALISQTAQILGSIQMMHLKLQTIRRVAQDSLQMGSRVDLSLVDPEYQVRDAVKIFSQKRSFPFIMWSQSTGHLCRHFNAGWKERYYESFAMELSHFAARQQKRRGFHISQRGGILGLSTEAFLLELQVSYVCEGGDIYQNKAGLRFSFRQLFQRGRVLGRLETAEFSAFVTQAGQDAQENYLVSVSLYYDFLQCKQGVQALQLQCKAQNHPVVFPFLKQKHTADRWREETKNFKSAQFLDVDPVVCLVLNAPGCELPGFVHSDQMRASYSPEFLHNFEDKFKYTYTRDFTLRTASLPAIMKSAIYRVAFYRVSYAFPYGLKRLGADATKNAIPFSDFWAHCISLYQDCIRQRQAARVSSLLQIPGAAIQNSAVSFTRAPLRVSYALEMAGVKFSASDTETNSNVSSLVQALNGGMAPTGDVQQLASLYARARRFKELRFTKGRLGFYTIPFPGIRIAFETAEKAEVILGCGHEIQLRYEIDADFVTDTKPGTVAGILERCGAWRDIGPKLQTMGAQAQVQDGCIRMYKGSKLEFEGSGLRGLLGALASVSHQQRPACADRVVQRVVQKRFAFKILESRVAVSVRCEEVPSLCFQVQAGQWSDEILSFLDALAQFLVSDSRFSACVKVAQSVLNIRLSFLDAEAPVPSGMRLDAYLHVPLPFDAARVSVTSAGLQRYRKILVLSDEAPPKKTHEKQLRLESFNSQSQPEYALGRRVLDFQRLVRPVQAVEQTPGLLRRTASVLEAQNRIQFYQLHRQTVGLSAQETLEDIGRNEHLQIDLRDALRTPPEKFSIGDVQIALAAGPQ